MSLAHNIQQGARTQDVRMPPNVTFETLLLQPKTLEGLKSSGFYKPSPIQLHGIPLGKCGFDLLLEAKSGTGKTAVFSIIGLEKLDCQKGVQVIILAPTREIAAQICDVMKQIGSCYEGLEIEVVMGGLPVQEDIAKFKNKRVQVVVGSPGRLKHLIEDKYIDVSAVRLLVLDEADKLMEKSFRGEINHIFALLPKQKQVIMSSATYPEVTKEFISRYVQNAQHICPDSDSVLLGIQQRYTLVKTNANIVKQTKYRFEELLKILSSHPFKQCLIFCNYQVRVSELHKLLKKEKWPAEQLYGNQEQNDRLDALKTLQEYKCRILIATDLAARGIDASNIDLVINFEPPFEWQTYLHRIGRAGRFGSYGKAVTILSQGKEKEKFKEILKFIKNAAKLSNLWDEEKLDSSDEESSPSESSSNTTLGNSKSSITIESQITSKDIVEEKVRDIIKEVSEVEPKSIESFLELQNSFAINKSANINKSSDNVTNKHIQEETTEISLDDETLQTIIQKVTNMIKSSNTTPLDIESFPDLKQSIENFRVGGEVQGKGGTKSANPTKQDNQKERDTDEEDELNNENISQNNGQTLNNSSPENLCESEKDTSQVLIPKVVHTYEHNNNDVTGDNDQSYLSNVAEALRQAGLPTAFGDTKFNKSGNKRKSKNTTFFTIFTQNSKNTQFENDKYNRYGEESEDDLRYENTNRHREGREKYSQAQNHRNLNNNYTRKSKTYDSFENSNSSESENSDNSESENSYNSESENSDSSTASSSVEYRKYFDWYKRLKQVTKQIEYSVYVNELSKM